MKTTTNVTSVTDGTTGTQKPARAKRTIKQVVVREFGDLGKYRVRLVKASEKPDAAAFLDVREYVHGANYEGFTRKGIRLGAAEAKALRGILESVEKEGPLG